MTLQPDAPHIVAGLRQYHEGKERLLDAIEHVCPDDRDPDCVDCILHVLTGAVLILLRRHEGESYSSWPKPEHDILQEAKKFLSEAI